MRERFEMRAVHAGRYGYIWNPWSDGKRVFRNESQSGLTFAAMKEAAKSDAGIAARVDLFVHRVPEELYDWEADPNALVNLAGDPKHKRELERLRRMLREWMARTGDPLAKLSPPPGELKSRGDDLREVRVTG
jgi:N-sulfoglucosamine sulfohydrolase